MRVVSVLEVADPGRWAELEAAAPLAAHTLEHLDDRRRIVSPAFDRVVLPALGARVLVRYPRRAAADEAAARHDVGVVVDGLRSDVRRVLVSAQRHALDGVVIGRQAWDPLHDLGSVRALVGAGLLVPVADDPAPPGEGRYHVHPDLPAPVAVAYDFADAVMEETDDLPAASPGPVALLHDMAALAAALEHHPSRVTHAGTLAVTDARRIGRRLGSATIAASGKLEEDERWGRAMRGLDALQVVGRDPVRRELHLDLGLDAVLSGETADATDRLVRRLVDRDLHVVVPAVRAALTAAGEGAVDEVVFLELLRQQHRDLIFPVWEREGVKVYPTTHQVRRYDADGWDDVETPMIKAVLARMARFGLIRRASGVFAASADGRVWAGAVHPQRPPVWVTGDLEMVVPPDALTVWERFQIERLGRCLQRDVVDRYRLERESLATWLSTHEVDEALALLRRRCPAVPRAAEETLVIWAQAACEVVLWRGVVMGG